MYPLVNPLPHFLVGDVCQVVGTTHEVVIKEVNCNTCQTQDEHQWSYSIHGTKDVSKTAWYDANELQLVTPIVPHHTMRFQTRRVAMQTQTNTQTTLPQGQPHGYPIGTILHGTNKLKGNLWIITVDQSYDASLLFDGSNKSIVMDSLYKRDRMRPNMVIATTQDVMAILGNGNRLPNWATALILTVPKTTLPLPKPSQALTPAAIQAVAKALGATATPQSKMQSLGLTKVAKQHTFFEPGIETSDYIPSRDCPARKEGFCDYQPYYGFTDTYMYCVHCDHKRNMSK